MGQGPPQIFLSDSWNTCRATNTRLETRLLVSVPEMFCGSSICTSGPSFKLFDYPLWVTEIPSVRLGYTRSDGLMAFKLGYVHLKVCPRRTCSWIGLREFPDPLDILYSFLNLPLCNTKTQDVTKRKFPLTINHKSIELWAFLSYTHIKSDMRYLDSWIFRIQINNKVEWCK